MVVIVAVSIISHARHDIAPVSCPGLHTSRVHGRVRLASGHQEGPSTPRISIRSRIRSLPTAAVAALPILTLIVLLGGMRMKAQWAVAIALATAIVVAIAIYGMPVRQAVLSAAEGATFGLFPIMWIVVAAIWVYNMTVETGHFAVLRRSIGSVSRGSAGPGAS